MKKSLILTLLATAGLALSTVTDAGNYPNTARTATRTIGSGAHTSRVPQSLPGTRSSHYSNRSQGRFEVSKTNYANRFSHRPDSTYPSYSPGVPAVSGKPGAFPGSDAIASHAGSTPAVAKTQFTNGFPPAAGSAQRPGAANHPGMTVSGTAAVPGKITSSVPAGISPPGGTMTPGIPATVSTGSGIPATLPPALPAVASGNMNTVARDHLPSQATGTAFQGLNMRPSGVGKP